MIIIVVLVFELLCGYFIYNNFLDNKEIIIENMLIENKTDSKEVKKELLAIHITGAVKNSGVVKLEEGSRIEDAINSAGGLAEDADITNVNLAFILEDGMKIKIPFNSDTEDIIITQNSGENIIKEELTEKNSTNKIININKAKVEDFETLPGIGNSLAIRIVKYREENGKFKTIEEIKNVSGIGDNKYEQIKDLISVK